MLLLLHIGQEQQEGEDNKEQLGVASPTKHREVRMDGTLRYSSWVAGCSAGFKKALLSGSGSGGSIGAEVEAQVHWQLVEIFEGSRPLIQPHVHWCYHCHHHHEELLSRPPKGQTWGDIGRWEEFKRRQFLTLPRFTVGKYQGRNGLDRGES